MRALGAKLIPVPSHVAWKALEDRSFPGVEGTFVTPSTMTISLVGHGTMGLEILEDAPDTKAVIASIGGGGLITGVGSALKALKPAIKIYGVEPETAAPMSLSLAAGPRRSSPNGRVRLSTEQAARAFFPECGNA